MKRKLLISEKELRGKFAESIYAPVAETNVHNINKAISAAKRNFKHLQEIDEFFKKDNTPIFRFFSLSIEDGNAFYQIINFDKNTDQFLVKRCEGICLDEYADGYIGNERWIDGDFVTAQLASRDAFAKLIADKNKKS